AYRELFQVLRDLSQEQGLESGDSGLEDGESALEDDE
ncbi:ribosome-associated protein, partial [Xanthomonas oryzae pv. oryzae]